MGLFYNFSKPGPGVSKNEPKKKGIALYFELFFRHITDFIKENMLYVLVSIPMFLIYHFLFTVTDTLGFQDYAIKNNLLAQYETIKITIIILLVVLCGSGPASAAMAYMMRCVTREEHCFLWTDFWDKFRENFKNGLIMAVIDILLISVIAPVAIRFYYMQYLTKASALWFFVMFVVIMIFILYIMMHMYFYQFIVTFELKFFEALKNSLIMTIGFLPINILILSIPVVLICILSLLRFTTIAMLIFSMIFLVAFLRYPIEFLASRMILKKVMVETNEDEGNKSAKN